jgi:hypothetical protein
MDDYAVRVSDIGRVSTKQPSEDSFSITERSVIIATTRLTMRGGDQAFPKHRIPGPERRG